MSSIKEHPDISSGLNQAYKDIYGTQKDYKTLAPLRRHLLIKNHDLLIPAKKGKGKIKS